MRSPEYRHVVQLPAQEVANIETRKADFLGSLKGLIIPRHTYENMIEMTHECRGGLPKAVRVHERFGERTEEQLSFTLAAYGECPGKHSERGTWVLHEADMRWTPWHPSDQR